MGKENTGPKMISQLDFREQIVYAVGYRMYERGFAPDAIFGRMWVRETMRTGVNCDHANEVIRAAMDVFGPVVKAALPLVGPIGRQFIIAVQQQNERGYAVETIDTLDSDPE